MAFTVYPIGVMLIKEANISKRLLPAIISCGQATFAFTAIPGTPQLNNIIPCEYLGTKPTAAPVLGMIAAVIMFGLGYAYLLWQVRVFKNRNEGFENELTQEKGFHEYTDSDCPKSIYAFLAIIILMGCFLLFDNVNFNGYQFNSLQAINTAMVVAIIYLCVLGIIRNQNALIKDTLAKCSFSWIAPLLNFCIIVGFGKVVQNTQGFNAVLSALLAFEASTYIKAAFSVAVLCGVTPCSAGGGKILEVVLVRFFVNF